MTTSTLSHDDPSPIRIVLFDVVGTLLYPMPSVPDVYASVGWQFGSQLSREQIARGFAEAFRRHVEIAATSETRERQRWEAIVRDVFVDVADIGQGLFTSLWEHFACPTAWRVFDDVLPIWQALERCGKTVGIASNFDGRLESLCRGLVPLDRAQHVFYSSRVGYPKPHRRFFERVQRQLAVAPASILLVGDDVAADWEGARAAGWQAILVDRENACAAIPSISRLSGLRDWLA